MIATIIGISSGLLVITIFSLLKQVDKFHIYGLILAAIGFLYVGFTWTDLTEVIVNSIQAIVFIFIAWYAVKTGGYILAFGYFLHGSWDLVYNLFPFQVAIPPHYDLFCLSIDFTIGFYLLWLSYRERKLKMITVKTVSSV